MTATTIDIPLTPPQRELLDLIDAAGWIAYYEQDVALVAEESELTIAEAERERELAATASLTDRVLTMPACDCLLWDDIFDHVEMRSEGIGVPKTIRAARSLLTKLRKVRPTEGT